MQSPASSSEQDSTNTTPVKVAATEIVNVSAKSRKRIVLAEGSPIGGSKRERKIAGQEELQFDTLIPFKNHPDGLECFSYNVVNYTSEPAPRHFVEALEAVMSDKSTNQKDPLDIIGAFKEWDIARPAVFSKKAVLTNQELALKDSVDKRFITYMSILRSTHCINIPVRVFCHLACKNGCPPEFKGYNDRTFRTPNMDFILAMLEGRPGAKKWNNIHNASMHMMLKWDEEELRSNVCPDIPAEEFANYTPKQIGALLEKWFEELDTPDLHKRADLEGILIPKAGQHRSAGIPRWVRKMQKAGRWQEVQAMLGTHLTMNFWLKEEQPVAHYLSGVSTYTVLTIYIHEFMID